MRALSLAAAFLLALTGASQLQAEEPSTRPVVGAWIGEMPIDPDFVTMQLNLDEVPQGKPAGKVLFCGPFIHCTLDVTFVGKQGDSFVFRIHDARHSYCANQQGREFSLAPTQADEWFFEMEEWGGRKVMVRLFKLEGDPVCAPGQGFPLRQEQKTNPRVRRMPLLRQP